MLAPRAAFFLVLAAALPVAAGQAVRSVRVAAPALPGASAVSAVYVGAALPQIAVPVLDQLAPIIEAVDRPAAGAPVESASAQAFDGARMAPPGAPVPVAPQASGLTGEALLKDLHQRTGRGYRPRGYEETSDYLFSKGRRRVVNGRSGVVDAYSGVFVAGDGKNGQDYPERGDQNGDGFVDAGGMNVEHLWPQSFFSKRDPMRSDFHALLTTFIHPNGVRGNLPFGVVSRRPEYENKAGAKMGQGVFEPPDEAKGMVARGLLYFYVRHHDRNIYNGAFSDAFWNAKLPLLLEWNRRYPPSDYEREQNDEGEAWQGNRNPFIDEPALADAVGVDAFKRKPKTRADFLRRQAERRARRLRR